MEQVQSQMPAKRWAHTVGVMESAVSLAQRYGADPKKAELAAMLHDYCKYWPVERQRSVLAAAGAEEDLLSHDKALWHGPAAAAAIPDETGITDAEVLDAVRWHTSGRVGMSLLDKIVCLADYIEEGRDFPGVNKIRKLAEHSLEQALVAGFDSTISHLLEKGQQIYPLTVQARNSLLQELGSK
jgi:predicted HD superfamily hydrolase involved in NAD metabolism